MDDAAHIAGALGPPCVALHLAPRSHDGSVGRAGEGSASRCDVGAGSRSWRGCRLGFATGGFRRSYSQAQWGTALQVGVRGQSGEAQAIPTKEFGDDLALEHRVHDQHPSQPDLSRPFRSSIRPAGVVAKLAGMARWGDVARMPERVTPRAASLVIPRRPAMMA